jgi:hypothetical protein
MAKESIAIQNALVSHWDSLRDNLRRVHSGIQFHPDNGYAILQPDYVSSTDKVATFKVGPIVINLPERGDNWKSDLFVVADCTLHFCIPTFSESKRLVSVGFATQVGYFRRGSKELQHVYGVHYDYDTERPAHPVFHAQMKSFAEPFADYVKEQFGLVLPLDDRVKGVLQNVRLPIAHLDFFSLVVQLAADHLMWEDSGHEERSAFDDILRLDSGIVGASASAPWLCEGAAIPCHRAIHWYSKLEPAIPK